MLRFPKYCETENRMDHPESRSISSVEFSSMSHTYCTSDTTHPVWYRPSSMLGKAEQTLEPATHCDSYYPCQVPSHVVGSPTSDCFPHSFHDSLSTLFSNADDNWSLRTQETHSCIQHTSFVQAGPQKKLFIPSRGCWTRDFVISTTALQQLTDRRAWTYIIWTCTWQFWQMQQTSHFTYFWTETNPDTCMIWSKSCTMERLSLEKERQVHLTAFFCSVIWFYPETTTDHSLH